MSNWCASLARDGRGAAGVEFAAVLPLLLLLLLFVAELGRMYHQAHLLEQGLRAGAMYAARVDAGDIAASSTLDAVTTLVKCGRYVAGGSCTPLIADWPAGTVPSITQRLVTVGANSITVIKVAASVPYSPLLPGLLDFFGLGDYQLTAEHEQAHLDN